MSIDAKFIGKTWPAQSYDVCKEKIKEYAKAIKNPDPHYVDEDFAKKSKYGCIIAPPTFCVVFGAYLIEPIFFDNELNLNLAMLVNPQRIFLPLSIVCISVGLLWGIPIILAGRGVSVGSMLAIVLGALFFFLGLIASQLASIRMHLALKNGNTNSE